jgi:GDSL-like Lipase/Acylhydrolase family
MYYDGTVATGRCTDYVVRSHSMPWFQNVIVHNCGTPIVVLLGDSITDLLAVQTLLPDMTVVKMGIGGNTCQQLLNRFHEAVVQSEADRVVIACGTNDVFHGVPWPTTLSVISQMVALARVNRVVPLVATITLL